MTNDKEFLIKLRDKKVYIPYRIVDGGKEFLMIQANGEEGFFFPVFFSEDADTGDFFKGYSMGFEEVSFNDVRNAFVEMPPQIRAIVIDPFGDNMVLYRENLKAYDKLVHGMTLDHYIHEGLELFKLTKYPKGLNDALSKFFSSEIGVNKAWLAMAKNRNEEFPHLIIIIDFFGSRHELFPKVAEVVKGFMPPGSNFEITQYRKEMSLDKIPDSVIYQRENYNSKRQ